MFAGSVRRIEREGIRFGLGERDTRFGVHQQTGEITHIVAFENHQHALALLEGRSYGLGHSAETAVGIAHSDAVNDKFYIVGLVAVDLHVHGQLPDLSIYAHAQESFFSYLRKELAIVALATLYERGHYHDVLAGIALAYEVDNLLLGILYHGLAACGGDGLSDTRIQQTDKIIDLGNGSYRGAGILVGGLLLDRNDGAESVDTVYVGTLHITDKMAGIGREGLHVATLAFGIDGVKGERRLAASAKTGKDYQLVAWKGNVYILEVVFACSENFYLIILFCHKERVIKTETAASG